MVDQTIDLTGSTTATSTTTIDGAIFQFITPGGAGTGQYNTFLSIQDQNIEEGFNTDATPSSTNDIKDANTHAVLLGNIPITIINGIEYYQFRLDLNENNNTAGETISLNQFKIYTGVYDLNPDPNITDLVNTTAELANLSLKYSIDDANTNRTLYLKDDSSGSGTDNYSILIPASKFAGVDPATTWLYVYAEFGSTTNATYAADGGFEEFNVQVAGTIFGTKFNDLNSDGIKQANEPGVAGVTIFIDANDNGLLDGDTNGNGVADAGETITERYTITDMNGNYSFASVAVGTYHIDEVKDANTIQTTGEDEVVTVTGTGSFRADIGNHYPRPHIAIDKVFTTVTDGNDAGTTALADGANDILNYTIAVTNDGELALENVVVSDLAANAGAVAVLKAGGFNIGDTNSNGLLDVNETWQYTATQTVTQADLDSGGNDTGTADGDVDNTASVTAKVVGSSATVSDSDDAPAPLTITPSLAIDKIVLDVDGAGPTGSVDHAGDVITYQVKVTNTGNVTLTNVTVQDPLTHADLLVASLAPGATYTSPNLTYTALQSDIDSNGPDSDHDIDNTATADSDQTGPSSDSEAVPVIYTPSLAIDKIVLDVDGAGPTGSVDHAGDVITYQVKVTNTGNVTLTNVTVQDPLTHADLLVASLAPGATYTSPNLTYTALQSDIDSNGPDSDHDIDNTATADSDQTGPSSDSEAVPVIYTPSLAIDKIVLDVDGAGPTGSVDHAGDVITYQVKVTNTGNVTLTNVTVQDPLTHADLLVASLAPGATYTSPNLTYTALQSDIDSNGPDSDHDIDNTATADSDQTGPSSDSEAVPVIYTPSLAIDKIVLDVDGAGPTGSVDHAGDVITYQVKVTNTGNVTLTNVTVQDPLTHADLLVASLAPGATYTSPNLTYTALQSDIDSNGPDSDHDIDNTATADSDQTGPSSDSEAVPVIYNPLINVTKMVTSVTNGTADGKADSAGDIINYAITIENKGNVTLDGVMVTDKVESYDATNAVAVTVGGFNTGDLDQNNLLDVGETWNYTASYMVTQGDLNTQGGLDGKLDNTATGDTNQTEPDTASASVGLVYTPHVDLTKYVSTDNQTFYDANDPSMLPGNITVQDPVYFKVTIENDGNIDLTNLVIKDTNYTGNVVGVTQTLYANGALTQYALDHNAVLTGDDNHDNILDVTETWTITYTQGFDYGQHINVADVSTAQGATDMDAAYYYGVLAGPGVRTPGFWSNLGAQFWDNIQNNETKVGPTFAKGELVYGVDSNHDGVVDGKDSAGLLVGDYNHNGLTDDGTNGTVNLGEDTLFIGLSDAKNLINAAQKTVAGDGVQMLGRDVVASWLNYLAGNGIGEASDTGSPKHFLNDAINWLQTFGDKSSSNTFDATEKWDTYAATTAPGGGHIAVKTSSAYWSAPVSGIDHSASAMHSALDHYNNTGQTVDGGIHYAMAADNPMDAMMINAAALIA